MAILNIGQITMAIQKLSLVLNLLLLQSRCRKQTVAAQTSRLFPEITQTPWLYIFGVFPTNLLIYHAGVLARCPDESILTKKSQYQSERRRAREIYQGQPQRRPLLYLKRRFRCPNCMIP